MGVNFSLGSLDFSLYSHLGGLIVGLMRGVSQTLALGFLSNCGSSGRSAALVTRTSHEDGGSISFRRCSASLGPEGPSVKLILACYWVRCCKCPKSDNASLGAGAAAGSWV